MDRLKFRTFDEADGVHLDIDSMSYFENKLPANDADYVMMFCDCEDSEGTDIYDKDVIVDVYYDDDNRQQFSYYPVCWNDRELQWSVDVSFSKDRSTLEPLSAHTNSLVVGNVLQGVSLYGHYLDSSTFKNHK